MEHCCTSTHVGAAPCSVPSPPFSQDHNCFHEFLHIMWHHIDGRFWYPSCTHPTPSQTNPSPCALADKLSFAAHKSSRPSGLSVRRDHNRLNQVRSCQTVEAHPCSPNHSPGAQEALQVSPSCSDCALARSDSQIWRRPLVTEDTTGNKKTS